MAKGILNDKPRLSYVVGQVEDKFNDLDTDEIIVLANILCRLDRVAVDADGTPIWTEEEMDVIGKFQELDGFKDAEDAEDDDEVDGDSDEEIEGNPDHTVAV